VEQTPEGIIPVDLDPEPAGRLDHLGAEIYTHFTSILGNEGWAGGALSLTSISRSPSTTQRLCLIKIEALWLRAKAFPVPGRAAAGTRSPLAKGLPRPSLYD